jgi:single-strand DNA-binding protein
LLSHLPRSNKKREKEQVMSSYNKVMIIGNLGQDPEIRYTPHGLPVVSFSVATDESELGSGGERLERTEWHRIVVAGKLASRCNEYLKKGRQVFIEGRLRAREGESNGAHDRKQRCTQIVASRVQFLGRPPTDAKVDDPSGDDGLVPESKVPF